MASMVWEGRLARVGARAALALLAGCAIDTTVDDGASVTSELVADGNLTANPSFEPGVSGWVGWQSTVSRVKLAGAPDGAHVAKVALTSGSAYTIDDAQPTVAATSAGKSYTATAYVRSASRSAGGKPVQIVLRERSRAGTAVKQTSSASIPLSSTFQRISVSTTALASDDTLEVYVAQASAARGDAFYVDLVTLQAGAGSGGAAVAPSSTSPPTISGSSTAGQTLTASAGSWSGTTPLSFRYAWRRCDAGGASCVTISGATDPSYALTESDVGRTLRVQVDASNSVGSASAVSAPTALVTAPATGDSAIPTSWRRSAAFESDLSSGTDGWNLPPSSTVAGFDILRTSEVGGIEGAGRYAAKIVNKGGNSGCSCPRMKFEDFSYSAGRDVWMSGAWLIPDPASVSWSRMMNLSHWTAAEDGTDNVWLVGLITESPGTMLVAARSYYTQSGQSVLYGPVPIPKNQWFRVDVHLKLSPTDGQALTEVFLDGQKVGSSTKRNMYKPGPLLVYQGGQPYFGPYDSGAVIYFDSPRLTEMN